MAFTTIASPCAAYNKMAQDWRLMDDLLAGTRVMRERQAIYLPIGTNEATTAYVARLNRSFLKPLLRKASLDGRGAVFRYNIDTSNVNAKVLPLLDDVDLRGNDLTAFLSNALGDMLVYGHCHLLAAYPDLGQNATQADVSDVQARPYAVRIDPHNVFSWKVASVLGRPELAEVRFFEYEQILDDDSSADAYRQRVVVLKRGEWEKWEQPRTVTQDVVNSTATTFISDDWVRVANGTFSLPGPAIEASTIPLATIYGDYVDFMVSRPPLLDLAWLNLAHWQSYSDYRNILHIAQVPFLFAAGMRTQDTEIKIGTSSAVRADDPGAKLGWVEHTGKAIESGRQELIDLESAMEQLGGALMSEDEHPGDQLATVEAIDTAEKQAGLGGIVRSLEDGANQFLWLLGKWMGVQDAGQIRIRRPIAMGGDEATVSGEDDTGAERVISRGNGKERTQVNARSTNG